MPTRRSSRLLFMTIGLVLSVAWPVRAEYHWNPFDHMTNTGAVMVFTVVGIIFLLRAIKWPLLLGSLVYFILKRTHPIAFVKISPVLLFCFLAAWVFNTALIPLLYKFLPTANHSTFSLIDILQLAIEVAGAVFGYFRQRNKAVI